MRANYQDAMAMCSEISKPHLYLTMTCNPQWKEITDNLREGEVATDRPDLTSRAFLIRYKEFIDDLLKKNIFGKVVGHCSVIEFQKRGLPHAHILLIIQESDVPRTCDAYDHIVCAELPNPETNPRLREIVTKHMIHGPCGTLNPQCVCMENSNCTKEFPKQCSQFTTDGIGSYPTYRRRNLHPYTKAASHGKLELLLNDSWIVPYNPWLLYEYNCHINVEICTSIGAVKYLYKYIFKGHDKASIAIVPDTAEGHQIQQAHDVNPEIVPVEIDEIKSYVDSRYVGAQEAVWRIFGNEMSSQYPPIHRLQVH